MELPPGTTGTVGTVKTETQTTSYAKAYLPQEDPNRVFRIVGFLEYSKALENFDTLARTATAQEVAAIDEIIKSEPEFTVYTNLSRRLEQGRSRLAERPKDAQDDFARKGFHWVTALARVELGAMLAGFTEHPHPLAAVAGTGYDRAEFKELIVDGAKMHFWALTTDEGFQEILQNFTPNGKTLTYLRRLNVASAFVYAAGGMTMLELTPLQLAEIKEYVKNLEAGRATLRASIENYLNSVIATTTVRGGSRDKEMLEMCRNGVCRTFGNAPAAGAAGGGAAGGGAPEKK